MGNPCRFFIFYILSCQGILLSSPITVIWFWNTKRKSPMLLNSEWKWLIFVFHFYFLQKNHWMFAIELIEFCSNPLQERRRRIFNFIIAINTTYIKAERQYNLVGILCPFTSFVKLCNWGILILRAWPNISSLRQLEKNYVASWI